jgi:phosphate starvation-inducible PhoH-like protein
MTFNTNIKNIECCQNICGPNNSNIKILEDLFSTSIEINLNTVNCGLTDKDMIQKLYDVIDMLCYMVENSFYVSARDIIYIFNNISNKEKLHNIYKKKEMIDRNAQGLPIYPKTLKQIEYVDTLSKKDMTFGIGPAGTGKTYLAVVYAVSLLKKGVVKRIILTRPAIEAGESLGFLPGDLKEKVDPYLRPLYDALYDMLGVETVNNYIEKGVIEIAPLAYMRGRTLENAFCILDEAQNTTEMQMKMFLTRMGFNSKMVITGDVSQIDLPVGKKSGLVNALNLLKNIKQIGVTKFEKEDVVRHPLVQKILEAYDRD